MNGSRSETTDTELDTLADDAFQARLLDGVSRTFAFFKL